MATKAKTKTFDCVESKRKAQDALEKEFKSRRREFASFADFLNAKMTESKDTSEIWKRFGRKSESPELS